MKSEMKKAANVYKVRRKEKEKDMMDFRKVLEQKRTEEKEVEKR